MLDFGFYNGDCMDYLPQFPDEYFDLAVVDPPYGNGGGGHGYGKTDKGSVEDLTDTEHGRSVHRTGGTWASKYGKKSLRGTQPQMDIFSKNCFVSHAIR